MYKCIDVFIFFLRIICLSLTELLSLQTYLQYNLYSCNLLIYGNENKYPDDQRADLRSEG